MYCSATRQQSTTRPIFFLTKPHPGVRQVPIFKQKLQHGGRRTRCSVSNAIPIGRLRIYCDYNDIHSTLEFDARWSRYRRIQCRRSVTLAGHHNFLCTLMESVLPPLAVVGRAEVRAYYVGTALCVAFAIWSLETQPALKAVRSCIRTVDILKLVKQNIGDTLSLSEPHRDLHLDVKN